jgi:hypothetical protein
MMAEGAKPTTRFFAITDEQGLRLRWVIATFGWLEFQLEMLIWSSVFWSQNLGRVFISLMQIDRKIRVLGQHR